MTRYLATITLAAVFAVPLALAPIDAQQGGAGRGTAKLHRKGARAIPNQYIVVLQDDAEIARGDYAAVLGRVNAVLRGEIVWEVLEIYFVLIAGKGLLQAQRPRGEEPAGEIA